MSNITDDAGVAPAMASHELSTQVWALDVTFNFESEFNPHTDPNRPAPSAIEAEAMRALHAGLNSADENTSFYDLVDITNQQISAGGSASADAILFIDGIESGIAGNSFLYGLIHGIRDLADLHVTPSSEDIADFIPGYLSGLAAGVVFDIYF